MISQNGIPIIIRNPRLNKLHYLNMVLAKSQSEVPQALITMFSDYTLWHQCMGHAHQHVRKYLSENIEGGPYQTTEAPVRDVKKES